MRKSEKGEKKGAGTRAGAGCEVSGVRRMLESKQRQQGVRRRRKKRKEQDEEWGQEMGGKRRRDERVSGKNGCRK